MKSIKVSSSFGVESESKSKSWGSLDSMKVHHLEMDRTEMEREMLRRKNSQASFKSSSEWGWFVEEDEMAILQVEGKEMDSNDKPHNFDLEYDAQSFYAEKPDTSTSPPTTSWDVSQEVLKANHPSYHSSVSSVSFDSSKNSSFPQGHPSNAHGNHNHNCSIDSAKDEVYDFESIRADQEEPPIETNNEMFFFAGKCVLLAVVLAVFRKYA